MDTAVRATRWQDWGNLLLGAWLFVSPFILFYPPDVPAAVNNAHLVGAAMVMLAALAMYVPRRWEETFNMLFGLWAAASPWVLGFAAYRTITVNALVVGVLVAGFAAWALLQREHGFAWPWQGHAMHRDG